MNGFIRFARFSAVIGAFASAAAGPLSAQAPSAQQAPNASIASVNQYSIMIWEAPSQIAARTDAKLGAAYWQAFAEFGAELQRAGVLRGGTALRTGAEVRTVTVRNGRTTSELRGHAQSPDELGGYFIIEVPTLEAAVRWAAKVPAALTGAVEVRPSFPAPTMMAK